MKKIFKRVLTVMLTAVMLLTAAPLSGFVGLDLPNLADLFTLKADAAAYSGKCGDNLTWSLDTDTGVLTISGTGDMYYWNYYGDVPWYSNRSSVKTVVIGDSVTSIGNYAFEDCTGLTSITIPDSVTSIGERAFYNCTGLTSVTIGNSVTSIGSFAFSDCDSLTSVTIGNSVTSIGVCAFYNCTGLTSVTIPDSVTSIGYHAFYNCTGLTSVTIPDSVTSIGEGAFTGCTGLTSVTIPDSVTSIGDYAFEGCTSLTSVTIGNSVTSIGEDAFRGCTGLTSVTIGNSVTSIGGSAFRYCESLTSVTIPDSVTSIGGSAFYGCTGLTSITVKEGNPNYSSDEYGVLFNKDKTLLIQYPIGNTRTSYTIPDSVTSIGDWAFIYCTSLTSVTIGNSVKSIGGEAFYDCDSLTSVTIGNSVKSIGVSAFRGCTGLTSVTIPDSVTSIGDYAFSGCTGLTSVTIGNSVTSIGYRAFYYCTGLTSVTIPDSVTSIGGSAFENCTGLTSVTIPDSVTSIGDYAFTNCNNIYLLVYKNSFAEQYAIDNSLNYRIISKIPDDTETLSGKVTNSFLWSIDKMTETLTLDCNGTMVSFENDVAPWIQYEEYIKHIVINDGCTNISKNAFMMCSKVESVLIPNSVTNINSYAFYGCSRLTGINIPVGVTSIGDSAFYRCTGLTSVTIGNSVTSIGINAFRDCTSLTSVTIPDSVTSIGVGAFEDCESLTSVTIPDSVTRIGNYAFYGCTGLTSISIPDSVTSFGSNVLSGCTKLTTLYIGSSNIYSSEFKNYTSLKNVTIGTGVTTIGDYAFNGCTGLEEIVIPYSVNSIGTAAFTGCTNLASLTIYSRNCTFADDATAYYTTIYGFTGSTAETYANEKGFDFVAIDDTHTHIYDNDCDRICNLCGADRTVCEHPSTHMEHKDSTCNEHGYDKSICDICGATVSTTELPYKHDYVATVTDPTCTEQGYTTYTCSLCGDSCTADYTEPLNHPHKTWCVTKNPTATSTGLMTENCDLCGAKTGEMEIPMLIPDFVTGITVSPNRLALNVGETANLTAIITPDTAENKNVIWSSSDTDIATVADGVVTAKTPGVAMIIVQSEDGGYKDFCVVRVASLTPANGAVVDNENGLIYGIASNSADINSYVNTVDDTMTVECDSALLGTGSVVNIVKDDVIVDSYKIVLFGDVNGDGWYDGMDAVTVSCIANGMLTKDQIGDAAYMAADCNHDGVVDEFDVALLNQAGVLLANVDQTKTQEELAADSDYAEYLNLIDQNPTVEEEPKKPEQDNGFIAKLIAFIETILKYIVMLVNKIS